MPTYDLGSKTLGRFFTHKTVVYQVGVMIYELLTKKSPYKPDPINTGSPRHYHPTEQEIKTFKDPTKDLETYFDAQSLRDLSLPEDAVLLIEQMCHPLPSERPTAKEVMDKWESICCLMRVDEKKKKKDVKEATSSI
jgi:serine/threonine protein kinase